MDYLSRKEELLLLSIWRLQDDAYGVTVREQLRKTTRRYWSIGAVYDVLDRLSRKELVSTTISSPLPERGGKRRKMYTVTRKGFSALEDIRRTIDDLRETLPRLNVRLEKS